MTTSTDNASSDSQRDEPGGTVQPAGDGGGDRDRLGELAAQSELPHPGGDPDLVSLVQLANAYGLEQPVVLTLAGQVLSGTLVGGRYYFERLASAVQGDDADDTMRGALAAGYRRRGEEFADWGAGSTLGDLDPEGPDDDALAAMPRVAYLHLRDVGVVGSPASGRQPLWRGRLADVVGWSVGGGSDTASAG